MPPTPTNLRVLRGNPGKRPIKPEPDPVAPAQVPDPPPFLMPEAKNEWHRIASELLRLRLLTVVDINTLAAYCQAYGRWRAAEEAVARMAERDLLTSGLMIKTTNGNAIQNPLVSTANKAAHDMVRYAAEFGLSPAARARIAADHYDEGPTSKFGDLLA